MLRVFEAFAGIGCQRLALDRTGIDYKLVGICEIDKYAIRSYEALHGSVNNIGDISKIKKEDIPKHDLLIYSFPCFIEGTKIMTINGYKNIEEIGVNDLVLTHTNTYQKVIKPMINRVDHLYKIDTMCSDALYTTEEHPFYVRKMKKVWNNSVRRNERKFDSPKWVSAKNLNKEYYVGVAINQKSELPNWDGLTFIWSDGRKDRNSNILKDKFNMPEFWWLIGRYIGDGWIRSGGGIIICCAYGEENEIIPKLNKLNFNYSISNERTVVKIHLSFKEIGEYVEQFGRGAKNKHLTGDIFNLPVDLLREFIEGYRSADGYVDNKGLNKISSISEDLIYGMGQCIAKAYNRPYSIYKTKRKSKCVIEGRLVNQNDTYEITWKTEKRKQDEAFYENGYIWCPIREVEKKDYEGLVYNMEVENDNSYTVNNIIVHNCQDISVAGHQASLDEGSGTRSSLLWECKKIIEACKPKYLILENVKNLVSNRHKHNFDKWLEYLEGLGYANYWKILDACEYDLPQSRQRVFAISILGDHKHYEFPNPLQLTKTIFDVLEKDIPNKYYLSQTAINKMKKYEPKTIKNKNIAPCLTTELGHGTGKNFHPKFCKLIGEYRKPLPIECFRLLGFTDKEFYKMQKVNSDTRLYEQAGNGIAINVMENIFKSLFDLNG